MTDQLHKAPETYHVNFTTRGVDGVKTRKEFGTHKRNAESFYAAQVRSLAASRKAAKPGTVKAVALCSYHPLRGEQVIKEKQ